MDQSTSLLPHDLFSKHPRAANWNKDMNGKLPVNLRCNNQSAKYWFTCDICYHNFDTIIHSIFKGSWCGFCANKRLCDNDECTLCFSKSFASHSKAKYWSPKNAPLTARQIYKNYSKKVWVKCECGYEFETKPNNVINDKWCTKCGRKSTTEKQRMKLPEFLERAKQLHGDKYDYTNINLQGVDTEITIGCPDHGQFQQTPYCHLKSNGCNVCARQITADKLRFTKDEFEEKAHKIHNNKYDYSKVLYISNITLVDIICPLHGIFQQLPAVHLTGCGCIKCGRESSSQKQTLTIEEFIKRAIAVHGDKYDYSPTKWINGKTNVQIICKIHGLFEQNPYSHLKGCGCRGCVVNTHSRVALEWVQFLESCYKLNIQHIANTGEYLIQNTKYKADGYDQDTNTIYEFNGDYWHGNPLKYKSTNPFPHSPDKTFGDMYDRTIKRNTIIKNGGYTLIEIWESDWTNAKRAVIKLQRAFRRRCKTQKSSSESSPLRSLSTLSAYFVSPPPKSRSCSS
jgi:hypothetical protein